MKMSLYQSDVEYQSEARSLSEAEYAALAHFRHALRRFTAFSDEMLGDAGLGPRRYQALLAIRAAAGGSGFSVGDLADVLIIKPNTAAELANRLEDVGLIRRVRDLRDRRRAEAVRLAYKHSARKR